jgi:hypothetical protein
MRAHGTTAPWEKLKIPTSGVRTMPDAMIE